MSADITIIYNEPFPKGFDFERDREAILGVMQCVNSVHIALLECGYIVDLLAINPPLERVKRQLSKIKTDLVFNLFEGFYDFPESEAAVAEMLELKGFRFTGCPSSALRVALDKANSKALMLQHGIRVPEYQVLSVGNIDEFELHFPAIVKPRNQDASHGIIPQSVVNNMAELRVQVSRILQQFENDALVEQYLSGREFNITVLGNADYTVLPPSEIVYRLPPDKPRLLTYEAKWITDSEYFEKTAVECPAKIAAGLRREIGEIAMSACRLFGCAGYARVDMRQDASGKLKVMEVNPNPDISPDTGAARQALAAGISYSQLIDSIVDYAREKVLA
jgi:D-alanine-D-alanine ligase